MTPDRNTRTKMKSFAALTSCMFSYCIFVNTPEATAFSKVQIPGGVSSGVVSKTTLAASNGKHADSCTCTMCSVGRDLSTTRQEYSSQAVSPVLGRAHGAGCPCESCSQVVRISHRPGCACDSCFQAVRASRGCGSSDDCKC